MNAPFDSTTASYAQDQAALATLSPNGSVPKERLSCPLKALNIYFNLIEANRERARQDTKIKGQIDGNAPYNPSRLKANGEGWRANFNTLEAKAMSSSAMVPYYDLFSGERTLVNVQTDYGSEYDREDFNQIIDEELDFAIKDWAGFFTYMDAIIYDYVNFGRAFPMNEDRINWRFRHVPQWRVMVPDGSEITDFDDGLDYIVVQQRLTVSRLYSKIRNEKAARALGWKIPEVKNCLISAVPEGDQDYQDPLFVQQQLKDNDLYLTTRASSVMVGNFYIREFDGSITHAIIARDGYLMGSQKLPAAWLFYKRGRFKSFRECVSPFFFEVTDNSWHGASGLGKDIFAPMVVKDRARMAEIDAHFMSKCLMLQAKTPAAFQKAALQVMGNCIMIHPDVNVQQASILSNITDSIAFNADMDRMISTNTGVYRPQFEKPEGNPEPAHSFALRAQQSTVLGESAVDRFYLQLDGMYKELYRRISSPNLNGDSEQMKAARQFQRRCMERGVPRMALLKVKSVRASRVIGNGSVVARQQAYGALMGVSSRMPEGGQENLTKDLVSVFTSPSKVARYMPKPNQDKSTQEQHRTALLENGIMVNGAPTDVTPSDNNLIHAQTHLMAMAQGAASLSQGGDEHGVWQFLNTAGPHVVKHLQLLGNDPARKAALAPLMQQWTKLAGITQKLGQKLQQDAQTMQKAQAITSGQDPDTQLAAAEMQAKTIMAKQKVDAGLALKKERQDAVLQMDREKHNQSLAIEDSATAAEILRKNALAAQPKTGEK